MSAQKAKITRDNLAGACRAHDNAVDIGTPFADIWERRGVGVQDAVYVAEQRALRMILTFRGVTARPYEAIHLTGEERALMDKLMAAWLDGLAVGLKVNQGGG